MPRIINQNPSPEVEKQVICRQSCGATVAYVPKEVQRIDGTDYGGGPDGCTYITCPSCRARIVLTSW